ncbi:aldo/keto reductase [Roseomonas sp. M0104]|uniref:Aldo/keto reductase n=1 Tax=Teichococcus coralli TaxID=2545983 RepID=A0A845BEA1_9PROT|nr:aldo/keto reductase [Pseudoroseomonas coralli]MXP65098.1 aldo/keto reductase [Pseudoroseomonas coralli]
MPSRPLGRTGIPVSCIGFGTAPLGDLYARLDERTAIDAVATAITLGVTLLDTSPLYGHGLAEHRCGTALRIAGQEGARRDGVVLSTKVGRWMAPREGRGDGSNFAGGLPHRAVVDYSFDGTLRSVEQSLLRLGTDRIEVLLIHDVDVWTHGGQMEQRFREAMEGAYPALHRLRAEGVVKAIGVGVNESAMCARFARAGDFDTMLLAGRYTLLEQAALDEFLPLALEKGIGVMLGGVFNSGVLATGAIPGAKYNYRDAPPEVLDRVRRMEAICAAHAVRLPDAALWFGLAHRAVASVVLGGGSPEEVRRNLSALERPVPAAFWAELRAAGLLRADAPVPA